MFVNYIKSMFFTLKIKLFNRKKLLFIVIIFLLPCFSYCQEKYSIERYSMNEKFFGFLYNFQFQNAYSLLANIDSISEPMHFNFLKAHYMRWYFLPIHQQNENILSQYNQYLKAANFENYGSELNYFSINSALLKAEYNYNQGNYYKAFQSSSEIYELVKNNLEKEPNQIEIKFLSSLYHYYYRYYKSENPVLGGMLWLFKEGNKEIGLKWLEEIANQKSVVRTEALIYLSHIYLRLENNPEKAFLYAKMLHNQFPNNLKFYELMIESYLANNIENEHLYKLIKELNDSDNIYFKKYGRCYYAILNVKFGSSGYNEKLENIEGALRFIHESGGGNHLSSLIYFQLYELTENDVYLKKKIEIEPYKYVLTGYRNF